MSNCKPDYKRAEWEALRILHNMGYEYPPVNPIKIAESLGITVKCVGFSDMDYISGMYDYEKNTIYYNHKDAPTRQLFTVAHELGHFTLHKDYIEDDNKYKLLLRSPHDGDKYELEADAFAANLMMPKFMINKFLSVATKEDLASAFCVSLQAIKKRIGFFSRFTNKYEQWY
jgi:Zn-dependent peptidase ImmA (M78 family)